MREVRGITGTPGTGKKSVAGLVGKSLRLQVISLTEVAVEAGLGGEKGGELLVDPSDLRSALRARCRGPCVVYGHLLPDVLRRGEVTRVAVLRCEPASLKGRLAARGYASAKVLENVEAELIGVVYALSLNSFGAEKVTQIDTTGRRPVDSARAVAAALSGSRPGARALDWMSRYASAEKLRSLLSAEMTESALT